jgi:hypothetical protein
MCGEDVNVPYRHHLTNVELTDEGDRVLSIRRCRTGALACSSP